jgi:hypothetical protein
MVILPKIFLPWEHIWIRPIFVGTVKSYHIINWWIPRDKASDMDQRLTPAGLRSTQVLDQLKQMKENMVLLPRIFLSWCHFWHGPIFIGTVES